jgi:hypothetical protein
LRKSKNDKLIIKKLIKKFIKANLSKEARMPHDADTRCGLFRISLNKSIIHEMIIGFDYTERENVDYWDEKFDCYVKEIEEMLPQSHYSRFEDWFCDNYNNTEIFDDIFKPEDDEIEIESEEEERLFGSSKNFFGSV